VTLLGKSYGNVCDTVRRAIRKFVRYRAVGLTEMCVALLGRDYGIMCDNVRKALRKNV
jgi:hypothetical protein